MAAKTSSISSSKTARAFAFAVALLVLVNVWVGIRLPALIPESSIDNLLELERRVALYDRKDRVKVLVMGNSHAVAGLKPPMLAEVFGLEPDEIFSLAIPSASPREMRILYERYRAQFPQVKTVVCGVEQYFLGADLQVRLRYITRGDWKERWRYAMSYPTFEERLGLVLGPVVPLVDFNVPLKDAISASPLLTAQRLFQDKLQPSSALYKLRTLPYDWGYPPPWNHPDLYQRMVVEEMKDPENHNMFARAWHFTEGHARVSGGLTELETIAQDLDRREIELVLVEMPFPKALIEIIEHMAEHHQGYVEKVKRYLAATGRTYVPAPRTWTESYFYDNDHLNPTGARQMVAWLKQHLQPKKPRLGGLTTPRRPHPELAAQPARTNRTEAP